jgi:hypothetical protein
MHFTKSCFHSLVTQFLVAQISIFSLMSPSCVYPPISMRPYLFYLHIQSGGSFLVNGVPFSAPSVPVLLQILSGTPAGSLMPNGSVVPLAKNQSVEIVIPGGAAGGPVCSHYS